MKIIFTLILSTALTITNLCLGMLDLRVGYDVLCQGSWQHMAELIDLGGNPNLYYKKDNETYSAPLISIIAHNFQEGEKKTKRFYMFTYAPVHKCHLRCVIELCKRKHKVDLNLKDSNGNTPLHNFINRAIKIGLSPDLSLAIHYMLLSNASPILENAEKKNSLNCAQDYYNQLIKINLCDECKTQETTRWQEIIAALQDATKKNTNQGDLLFFN